MPISQFNEAEIIAAHFGGHIGTFLDIGASSGVALSNTFELGLKGWHGLLVEASPIHFQNLVANYIHRGGFQFLNAALWTERKLMKFHLNNYFYSSLIEKEEPNLYHAHYYVPTVVAEDLKSIQDKAEFISLDIEGADILVFPSLMRAYPDCRLVCVEHANNGALKEEWKKRFAEHGLRVIGETPENYLAATA